MSPPAAAAAPPDPFVGGHRVGLLQGGDELFAAMQQAMAAARMQVWLVTYIIHPDEAGQAIADALCAAARRGVQVHVIVDGFGSMAALPWLRQQLVAQGVLLDVFRPLDRWSAWLQPSQLRRLHHKLCVVDDEVAFVGGINILDDRHDLRHGRSLLPRLDYAIEVHGPVVAQVRRLAQADGLRCRLGQTWRSQVGALAGSRRPMADTLQLLRRRRGDTLAAAILPPGTAAGPAADRPVRVAFLVRDNIRRRRDIERSYIHAVRSARHGIDIVCPYFYPHRAFRRSLMAAAQRGVQVRLLLQGKADYRIAALAARVLYGELLARGVRVFEYTPAFLHAKVAVVDDHWATVGSSNIDPLSLLLNLEANVMVRDAGFAAALRSRIEQALAVSHEVTAPPLRRGWRHRLSYGFVAWCANLYLRVAGVTERY